MEHKDLNRLEVLRQKNANPEWVNDELYRLMYKPDLYVVAYERLKSKPGNMTPGPDGSTLDGFSMKSIERIISSMRDESFVFSRARRVLIPKAKGGTRPLGVAPPRDKVVQEVMRVILESIYDSPHGSSFSESSHGFRPGRGCHTALKAIRHQWSGVTWIVEGDVKAAFDNIDHDILINVLRKRISDERFLRLIRKALTAGYYEFRRPVDSVIGTPQGSVLSPILCNVFLNELDTFCEELVALHQRGKARKTNPAYRNLSFRMEVKRRKLRNIESREARAPIVAEIRKLKSQLLKLPSSIDDGSFIRVKYVRYADDFVIGINGPKQLAETLRTEVADFMQGSLGLTLSLEKTHIRYAKTEEAFFLGTRVKIGSSSARVSKVKRHGRTFTRRTAGWTPMMRAPILQLVSRLHSKGFCDAEGKPKAKSSWAVLDDDQIVSLFSSVNRGLLNYYSFVDDYSELSRIQYILQHSAARTLATKHRLSVRRVFRKYDRSLRVVTPTAKGKDRVTEFWLQTSWVSEPNRFLGGVQANPDEALQTSLRLRTRSKLGATCVVCTNSDVVVMHHVRHIRKMGEKVQGFTRILATVNRKQIPVCDECHSKIHRGEYDGMKLGDLANPALAAL